jgi:uncharacterized protein (TIGR02996 family)
MNPETPFLVAIQANPSDVARRLIYADWLEERGEMIRVEEEMRALPVFSDRFWELKPRRLELLQQLDEPWLESIRYGTDCPPTFAHVPCGWREWWRLIRVLTERWHGSRGVSPLPDVGGRSAEVQAAEARLGVTFSPSMREWVAFARDVRRSGNYHDVLRDVYTMERLPNHPAISLLLQCEGDYYWAVHHADLDKIDPPVHGDHWDLDSPDPENTFVLDERSPLAKTLTAFVLDYSLGYLHADGGGFGADVKDCGRIERELARDFPVTFDRGVTRIYEMDNILVQLQGAYIKVNVFKPLPRDLIPDYLWDCTRDGGSFYGMFTPK